MKRLVLSLAGGFLALLAYRAWEPERPGDSLAIAPGPLACKEAKPATPARSPALPPISRGWAPIAADQREDEPGDPIRDALAAANAIEDPDLRHASFEKLVGDLSLEDGYAFLDTEAHPGAPALHPEFSDLLLQSLAVADVARLEAWARAQPESHFRAEALAVVAVHRSEQDLSSALAWASQLGSAPSERAAALQVAIEAAQQLPVDAVGLVAGQLPSVERDDCLAHCVAQWAAAAPAEAAAWVTAIEDEHLRARLLSRVLIAAAAENPSTAAHWTSRALSPGPIQERTAVAVAQRWAQKDPEQARAWILSFPDTALKENALAASGQGAGPLDPAGPP